MKEWSKARAESQPIKNRLRDPNGIHFLSDLDTEKLIIEDDKYLVLYELFRKEHLDSKSERHD